MTLAGGVLLLAGVGTATAVVVAPTSAESDVFVPAETTAPATSSAPEAPAVVPVPVPVEAPAPVAVEPPVADTPAASVDPVTSPEQAPTQAGTDGVGTTGEDGQYTPAPPRQNPGEPPYVGGPGMTPAEPLPGEPGYVGPAN